MTKQEYIERMQQYEAIHDEVWTMIVRDTNDFLRDNPTPKIYDIKTVESMAEGLGLSGTWIIDRITNKNPLKNGSLTKRFRRLLGYYE